MSSLLRTVSRSVARWPLAFLVGTLVTTIILTRFIQGPDAVVDDDAAFSPDTPEIRAMEELGSRFADAATLSLQVVVTGDDVVSAGGVATVAAVEEAARGAFGEALRAEVDGPPAIVSFLLPAQVAAQQGGIDLAGLGDDGVDQVQGMALAAVAAGAAEGTLPPEASALADLAAALASGDDPLTAPSGLVLVRIDGTSFTDRAALTAAIDDFVEQVESLETPLRALPFALESGGPDDDFAAEVAKLFQLAALIILAVLALVLRARRGPAYSRLAAVRRSVADMGLALVSVVLAIAMTMGFQGLLGPEYLGLLGPPTPGTMIVPILLLALGIDYAIHTNSRYREEIAKGKAPADVVAGLGPTLGVALLLAMLTTAVGFLTNRFSPIPSIQELGSVAAIGIFLVFVLNSTFLPAARLLLDRLADRRGRLGREEVAPEEGRLLARLAVIGVGPALRAPIAVLAVAGTLAAGGAYGLTQLDTEFSIAAFLPDDSPQKEALSILEQEFGGGLAEQTQVLVRGAATLTPEHHNATAAVVDGLVGAPGLVTLGDRPDATTPVSALARAVADAATPEEAAAVDTARAAGLGDDGLVAPEADVAAIYTTMVAAFPAAAQVVDPDPAGPAVRLAVRTQSASVGVRPLAATITNALAPVVAAGGEPVVVSEAIIRDDITSSLSSSQARGLVLTLAAVMVLLAVVYQVRSRQPVLGVLVMLPVAAVVLWTFGAMAIAGIPFDPVTAVISSLVVGIGVDFCIHLGERYQEDLEAAGGDVAMALNNAMHHTGSALAGSAATTTFGFAVLATSSIVPFQRLGTVTIYAMVFSLLATMFVQPPLLVLYSRRRAAGAAPNAEPVAPAPIEPVPSAARTGSTAAASSEEAPHSTADPTPPGRTKSAEQLTAPGSGPAAPRPTGTSGDGPQHPQTPRTVPARSRRRRHPLVAEGRGGDARV